ncbi:hypothetical protein BKA61DRAFT_308726 [Leptodontidium sp. MPI-SDFR-AT-0119]|nr:hypothetical protein BKA61DRAFT_308726 [Leptodontidium sp. MPI-SDFR-AT-0119]
MHARLRDRIVGCLLACLCSASYDSHCLTHRRHISVVLRFSTGFRDSTSAVELSMARPCSRCIYLPCMHISTQCQTRSHPDRCCWTPLSSPPKKYFGSSLQPAKVPLILWPPDPIITSLCVQLVGVLYRLCGEIVEGDSSAEKQAAQRPICPGPVLQRTAAPSQNPLQTAVTFG